jgi:hypothetical protein
VKSNSLMSAVTDTPAGPPPLFASKDGKRGTRFVEREFLTDISSAALSGGATIFNNSSFPINPTNTLTFPWLSSIASLYDQWEPHGIVFEFVSTSSEYASSQALGAVIMSTDYDATDLAYASKQEMENADYACSTKPSQSLVHGIECASSERPLRVLYTNNPTASFSTLGNFQIASTGCSTAGVKLGELWVSYDITFFKKQLPNSPNLYPIYNANGNSVATGPFFGPPTIVYNQRIIEINNAIVGQSSIVFPSTASSGRYFISLWWSTTSALAPGPVNCTIVQNNATGNLREMIVDLTSQGASLNFNVAATNFTYTLLVYQVPSGTTV